MRDYEEIERILRRYDFRTKDYTFTETTKQAIHVLNDFGYTVDVMGKFPYLPQSYTLSIDNHQVHTSISDVRMIRYTRDIIAEYRDNDMAVIVEYTKETGYFAMKQFGESMSAFVEQDKKDNPEKYASINTSKQIRDAQLQASDEDDTCYCGNPLVNNMCSYCAGTDEDYDEADDCCDWGDQIEALSDRIERLERGAKTKDTASIKSDVASRSTRAGKGWRIYTPSYEDNYNSTVTTTGTTNDTWHFWPWSPSDDSKNKPAVDAVSIIFDGVEYTKKEAAVLAERQAIIDHLRNQHAVIQQVHYFTDKYRETQVYLLSVLSKLISEIEAGKHNG